MLQKKLLITSWGIGLSAEQCALVRETLGEEHQLLPLDPASNIPEEQLAEAAPFVIWLSSSFRRQLPFLSGDAARLFEEAPKAVLLEPGYSLEDFENACEHGITEFIRPPATKDRVAEVMRRAIEAYAVSHDIDCMTREILLERELLERKNELLGFLVNFLTNTTESPDINYLMQTAFTGLGKLLPIRSMHAILWEQTADSPPSLSLHISAAQGTRAHDAWHEALLEQARPVIGAHCSKELYCLELPDQEEQWRNACPSEGSLLALPIVCGTERLGVLLLLTAIERHLGRDQAMALDSAMRHFALTLKNVQRFALMQMYADYDALTGVHSRRHFEARFEEEFKRMTRYAQPLSLLMLDIDHFKAVNDTRGHHSGDIVLRDVASIIAESIRTSDYCARYGGEEFVIILPHTNAKKAVALAERIRKKIASTTFLAEGGMPLTLTASVGVGSLQHDSGQSKQQLVCVTDAALYAAKSAGRNRTLLAQGTPDPISRLAG